MVSSNRKNLAFLVLVLAAYGIAVWLSGGSPDDRAQYQVIAFPFILFAFGTLSIRGVRVPRSVLAFALAGTLTGAVFTYTHVDLAKGAFIVARFTKDELEADTKITRDRIRRFAGEGMAAMVGSHSSTIDSRDAAEEVLSRSERLGGVVWGTTRWINVSLRTLGPLRLSSLPKGSAWERLHATRRLPDLGLITSVPIVGMSDSTQLSTLRFIGGLVNVWNLFPAVLPSGIDDPSFEQRLRSLAAMKASWTSFAHRALPMWMTGTYHLTRSIAGPEFQGAEIACALSAFEAAQSQLRAGDSPELQIAILNNLAIAYLVRTAAGINPRTSRKAAVILFERAAVSAQALAKSLGTKNELLDPVVANLSAMKKGRRKQKARPHSEPGRVH